MSSKKALLGPFDKSVSQVLKKADFIACVDRGIDIYVSAADVCVWRMDSLQYNALVHPVVKCAPGDWVLKKGCVPHTPKDLPGILENIVQATEKAPDLVPSTLRNQSAGRLLAPFLDLSCDAVLWANAAFVESIDRLSGAYWRSAGPHGPLAAYVRGHVVAAVCPVLMRGPAPEAAARAWFEAAAPRFSAGIEQAPPENENY